MTHYGGAEVCATVRKNCTVLALEFSATRSRNIQSNLSKP
jgi:hypothetical protein